MLTSLWDFLEKVGSETTACQKWRGAVRDLAGVMSQAMI